MCERIRKRMFLTLNHQCNTLALELLSVASGSSVQMCNSMLHRQRLQKVFKQPTYSPSPFKDMSSA